MHLNPHSPHRVWFICVLTVLFLSSSAHLNWTRWYIHDSAINLPPWEPVNFLAKVSLYPLLSTTFCPPSYRLAFPPSFPPVPPSFHLQSFIPKVSSEHGGCALSCMGLKGDIDSRSDVISILEESVTWDLSRNDRRWQWWRADRTVQSHTGESSSDWRLPGDSGSAWMSTHSSICQSFLLCLHVPIHIAIQLLYGYFV